MQYVHMKLNPEFPCKSSIQQKEVSLHEQTGPKSQAKICEMVYWEHSSAWPWNVDTSESIPEITWKFWNVVLEKDIGDQWDRSC